MFNKVSSVKNKNVKNVLLLQSKSRERKKQNLIVVEGIKECDLAIKAGVKIKQLYFCPNIIDDSKIKIFLKFVTEGNIYEISQDVFSKISYRESTGGILIVAEPPQKLISDLSVNNDSLFIVLESVEKPGNLGAIARVADGAGVDGIILSDPLTDIYNPNSIRASLGCVFTNNIVVSDYNEAQNWLAKHEIKVFAAELTASKFYHKTNLKGKVALVFGTEAYGLTEKWLNIADERIKIPMAGRIDSLNVSTSVAVLVYEAKRQRDFLV